LSNDKLEVFLLDVFLSHVTPDKDTSLPRSPSLRGIVVDDMPIIRQTFQTSKRKPEKTRQHMSESRREATTSSSMPGPQGDRTRSVALLTLLTFQLSTTPPRRSSPVPSCPGPHHNRLWSCPRSSPEPIALAVALSKQLMLSRCLPLPLSTARSNSLPNESSGQGMSLRLIPWS
jgi:hypothetical protein